MAWKKLPSWYLGKVGRAGVIPILIITACAVFFSGRTRFEAAYIDDYSGSRGETDRQLQADFESYEYVAAVIESDDLYSRETLSHVQEATHGIESLPEVKHVISAATLKAPISTNEGETVDTVLPDLSDGSIRRLGDLMERNDLYRSLVQTRHGGGWVLLVVANEGFHYTEYARAILNETRRLGIDSRRVFGLPVLLYYLDTWTQRDFFRLITLSLIIVFCAEWAFCRHFSVAVLLWTNSILSTLWTIALFGLFRIPINTETLVVPVEVLTLSTSYGIHLFRFYTLQGGLQRTTALDSVTPIIALAGGTTLIGFGMLLVSAVPSTRRIGLYLVAGISISMLSTLFSLPSLFAFVPDRKLGFRELRFLRRFSIRSSRMFYAVLAICIATGVGAARLQYDPRISLMFHPWNELSKTYDYFSREHYGIDQIEIIIDTGTEYGLVDLETYSAIKEAAREIGELPDIQNMMSVDQIIEWTIGGLEGLDTRIEPTSSAEIGETLELLSYQEQGFNIDSLVDINYQTTKIIVPVEIPAGSSVSFAKRFNSTMDAIRSILARHGIGSWHASGVLARQQEVYSELVRGQFRGVGIFLGAVFLIGLLAFRSAKYALLILVPAIGGGLVYFGAVGWAGYRMCITVSVSFALVMGVGVDDVIYLIRMYVIRRDKSMSPGLAMEYAIREAGVAIVETTVIIILGLSVLLFVFSAALFYACIAAILGLTAATALTMIVVPKCIGTTLKKPCEP